MRKRFILAACAVSMLGILAAACDGGTDEEPAVALRPELIGTPLPTATAPPPTPVICDVPEPIPAPPNIDSDVVFPAGFAIESLETTPHLKMLGRASVLSDPALAPEELSIGPTQLFERRVVGKMRDLWRTQLNSGVSGRDYTLSSADGRVLHLNFVDVGACPEHGYVLYEFFWITPVAGN
jgi:hypothetical protein